MKILNLSLLFALTLSALTANASERFIELFNNSVGYLHGADTVQFRSVIESIDARAYPIAEMKLSQLLVTASVEDPVRARLLANLGVLKAINSDPEEGLVDLADSIELMESAVGPWDSELVGLLMAKGVIGRAIDAYEVAEEALRRAQHISHRHDGVYTPNQLPIVEQLTYVHLDQGLVLNADREQRFNLRISEQAYGEESAEIVPVLQQVGTYMANRAETLPVAAINSKDVQSQAEAFTVQYRYALFREAIALYSRAIRIIEEAHGPDDLRLVPVLHGLAEVRLMQRTATRHAEKAMERATDIVVNNPGTDVADHARALVELGDVFTITTDPRAEEKYLEAWELLSSDPRLLDVRYELFGTPKRLFPERTGIIALDRRPISVEEGDPLFANLEFSVIDNGRVAQVKVIDGNVPNERKNQLRRDLREVRFRPRIVDGETVSTEGLTFHQAYEVVLPRPEFRTTTDSFP